MLIANIINNYVAKELIMSNLEKLPIVFVCSPLEDLVEERRAVIYALEKLQLKHNCMETFGARTVKPIETALSEVRHSDIMLVILGHKYGSLVPGTNISFSEAEYMEGYQLGKPCLVYLKDEGVPVPPKYIEHNSQKSQALNTFKNLLKERHTVAYFRNSFELAVTVAIDLNRQIETMSKIQIGISKKAQLPEQVLTPVQEIWNLKMHHDQTATAPYHLHGHLPWIQDIERVTNGRVKITIYPQETIMKSMEVWEGIQSGIADIAWIFQGYYPHQFDLSDSVTLPFIVPNAEIGSKIAWNLYHKYHEIQAQMTNMKVLSVCTSDPYFFLTTRKQVKVPADLKGTKIRTTGKWSAHLFSLLGGSAVMVPISETYLALQRGVLDGLLTSTLPILDFRLYEVAQYCTYIPTTCAHFMLIMNENVWNSMPSDIQEAIMSVSGEVQARRYGANVFDQIHKELSERVKAFGYQINEYTVPSEELAKWITIMRSSD